MMMKAKAKTPLVETKKDQLTDATVATLMEMSTDASIDTLMDASHMATTANLEATMMTGGWMAKVEM